MYYKDLCYVAEHDLVLLKSTYNHGPIV